MDYTTMRHFADSWGLLGMFLFFLFVVFFAFRPGSKQAADAAKAIPFKDENNE